MKTGKRKLPKAPSMRIDLEEVMIPLTKEQNDERIKRLAHKIVRIMESYRKGRKLEIKSIEELLDSGFEKSLGL